MDQHPKLAQIRKRQSSNSGVAEPHPALADLDPSTAFLYRPRTITFGALGAPRVYRTPTLVWRKIQHAILPTNE